VSRGILLLALFKEELLLVTFFPSASFSVADYFFDRRTVGSFEFFACIFRDAVDYVPLVFEFIGNTLAFELLSIPVVAGLVHFVVIVEFR